MTGLQVTISYQTFIIIIFPHCAMGPAKFAYVPRIHNCDCFFFITNHFMVKSRPNGHNMSIDHITTMLGATYCMPLATKLGVVGSSLKMVQLEPTTPNMSQYVTTWTVA